MSTPASSMVDLSMSQAGSTGFLALHVSSNSFIQSTTLPPFQQMLAFDFWAPIYTSIQSMVGPVYQPLPPFTSVISSTLYVASSGGPLSQLTSSAGLFSSTGTSIEQAIAKQLAEMEVMIQRIPGVPTPLKKILPHTYADSLFFDSIILVEMPKKFFFPNMKLYDGTTNLTDHIASYKHRMFTATIPQELHETCICKSFGSSLMGPNLQWYTKLPNSISYFA